MYFDIRKNPNATGHKYWWVAVGDNHRTICQSEMLSSKQACKDAIRRIKDDARGANVYDETGDISGTASDKKITV